MIEFILLQVGASCLSSVSGFLTAPYTAWFPIAAILAAMVISVLAVIYAVAPLFGKEDIRANVKISIYQALFSLVLIAAFGIFSTWLCTFNAQSLLNAIGLSPSNVPQNANLYKVAISDLYWFTNSGPLANLNNGLLLFFAAMNMGPQINIGVNFVPGIGNVGLKDSVPLSLAGPLNAFSSYLTEGVSWLFIMNDLQFIIISAAPIMFAIFLAIGLIARIFGPTRNFGGALIALGVGIGFVYPLMVSVTYGFINNAYNALMSDFFVDVFANTFGTSLQSIIANVLTGSFIINGIESVIFSFANLVGFTATASLILPMLNFIVVDTFVVDFSSAFGEEMSFMSLLTRII
ncbi:MAG: hypothetical protein ACP5RK_00390 [Candidatus Micrarchaeia archaeon]